MRTLDRERPPEILTRHGTLRVRHRPLVMGIVNATPDSFSDGRPHATTDDFVALGERLVAEGADLLDVGGESTRPGSRAVPESEEIERVIPVVRALRERGVSVPLSVDTRRERVAREALAAGADMVNDVSALRDDPQMLPLVAAEDVPCVLMHRRGTPETMQDAPVYADVVAEVVAFLAGRLATARAAGVRQVLIDPGIGFGKTAEHNLALLGALDIFGALGTSVLVGASRKRVIGDVLGVPVEGRLAGSLAVAAHAAACGVACVRVHDVRPTRELLDMLSAIRAGAKPGEG